VAGHSRKAAALRRRSARGVSPISENQERQVARRWNIAQVNPATGVIASWQTAPQRLPQGRYGHGLVAMRNTLVLTGGRGCGSDPCADAVEASTDSKLSTTELLDVYRPQLRYSNSESYRADSAATITDNCVWDSSINKPLTTNYLNDSRGKHLAASCPQIKGPDLSLAYLGSYGGSSTDRLDEDNDYEIDAQRMHGEPQYRDKIYARAVDLGPEGKILQYWFGTTTTPSVRSESAFMRVTGR
jgi:hypothetical protein